MTSILIVEDEPRIQSFIAKGLRAASFATQIAGTGREAIDLAATGGFDLVILDLGLPDIDGFSVLEQLRGMGVSIPVIILTARSSIEDTVAGLEGGADDYVSKPFRFEELLARVRLRVRDAVSAERSGTAVETTTLLRHGGVEIDLLSRRVLVDGAEQPLSAREFALAVEFLRHPGQVLTREQLLSRVWGYDFDPSSNVVDVYVRYLRGKLGAERFETVRGVGYRLS